MTWYCRTLILQSMTFTGPVPWATLWGSRSWPTWSPCWWKMCSVQLFCLTSWDAVPWLLQASLALTLLEVVVQQMEGNTTTTTTITAAAAVVVVGEEWSPSPMTVLLWGNSWKLQWQHMLTQPILVSPTSPLDTMATSLTFLVKRVIPLSLPTMGMRSSRSLWRTWK